jgi:hypothetical protein
MTEDEILEDLRKILDSEKVSGDFEGWKEREDRDSLVLNVALDVLSETVGTARLVLRAVKGSADRDCSATLIATIQGRDLRIWRMDWRPVHSHTNRCGGREHRGLTSWTGIHEFACNAKLGLERMQSEDLPICLPIEDEPHDFDAFVRHVSSALKISITDKILGPPWSLRLL